MTRWRFRVAQWILLIAVTIAMIDVLTPETGNAMASIVTVFLGLILAGIFYAWGRTANKYEQLAELHSSSMEKRKRERLDNVLRDLSSDDLMRLKQRLMDGSVDDDMLYNEMVGDDGELVPIDEMLNR